MNAPSPSADRFPTPPPSSSRPAPPRCHWCGRVLADVAARGRPRKYCNQSCRQRAYEQRAMISRHDLPTDAVILTQRQVDELHDALFALRCATEDVATAVEDGEGKDSVMELIAEVLSLAEGAERFRTPTTE